MRNGFKTSKTCNTTCPLTLLAPRSLSRHNRTHSQNFEHCATQFPQTEKFKNAFPPHCTALRIKSEAHLWFTSEAVKPVIFTAPLLTNNVIKLIS